MNVFDPAVLRLPFFDDAHRALAARLEAWVSEHLETPATFSGPELAPVVRDIARRLARDGILDWVVRNPASPGASAPDFRAVCLVREALAYTHDLYDFVASIQSLATYPIARYGSEALRTQLLPGLLDGSRLGSLAISEPHAGSDVAAIRLSAKKNDAGFCLSGEKAWIANGNVADVHCVLARIGEGPAAFAMTLFAVPSELPGVRAVNCGELVAPRPLSGLRFEDCNVPASAVVGKQGHGFRYALEILERYRVSVGAAAIGFARRAMKEALSYARRREVGGSKLADLQMTKERLADMAVTLDASALLVARTAWEIDTGALDALPRHASATKLFATEGAQEIIDRALQMFGAAGLVEGTVTERLYRQVRGLRIYEGTSEIQKLIVAGALS